MSTDSPIGRVVATENHPTSTGSFRFWLAAGVNLKPFDFVQVQPPENGDPDIGRFYAIIDEIHQVSDEPSPLSGFISSDFGNSSQSPRVGRVVTTYADATVLYNTNDIEMPVPHGSRVRWPDEDGVRRALGIDEYRRNTPAGYITMSGPEDKSIVISVDMDADYLVGPEGAHLNISGVSGLATKTSYAMFILSAIQQRAEDWPAGTKPAFVVLNVKGADLLRLHESDPDLNDQTRADWERCDLECKPLSEVTYFYPYSSNEPAWTQTMLSAEEVSANVDAGRANRYFYDVKNALERLHLLFEDMDDPAQTLVSCVEYCRENVGGEDPWSALRSKVASWARETPDKSRIPVVSWRRFFRLFGQRTRNGIFTELARRAEDYRQVSLSDSLCRLQPGQVAVVDIAKLPDYLQAFVVGDVISALREPTPSDLDDNEEQGTSAAARTAVLFADELNKFAPKHGGARSLTGHLREISERGRSEGIILFGAEQFRTSVDDRVTGNSGTHVFGRTTAVESQKDSEIRLRPQSRRVPFLRKGELLVSHTRFSAGTLKLRFPRNAYRQG